MMRFSDYRVAAITLAAMLVLASMSPAEAFIQRNGPATLELRTPGGGNRLALADLLTVVLTVEGDAPLEVKAPLEMPADSPWLLVRRARPTRESITGKRVRWRLEYEFAPREPGKLAFLFPEVVVGPDSVHTWTGQDFEVATSIQNAEKARIREISGIEPLPGRVEPPSFAWLWVVAGLFSFGFGTVLFFFLRRNRTKHQSAAEVALLELARLEVANGDATHRLIALSSLVRQYLERDFALPAPRRTTHEFVMLLEKARELHDDEKRFLADFFQATETNLYAGVAVSDAQYLEWADGVHRILVSRSDSGR